MAPSDRRSAAIADVTIGTAIAEATARLRASGLPTPRLDAELIAAFVTDRERAWLLAHPEAALDDRGRMDELVGRRAAGEPIAYLRGFKEWRSLRIRTDGRALIPRPETEQLADAAIAELAERMARDAAPIVAWEVGTGSGAVAVALALRFRTALTLGRIRLIASDRSADALELASENLAAHGVADLVDLACADLLEPAGASLPRPDVVVANLPYVPTAEIAAAAGSLAHEPPLALDGGSDGLDVIARLLSDVEERAAQGATVLLEIGSSQSAAVRRMSPHAATVTIATDLAGVDRVVRIGLGGGPA